MIVSPIRVCTGKWSKGVRRVGWSSTRFIARSRTGRNGISRLQKNTAAFDSRNHFFCSPLSAMSADSRHFASTPAYSANILKANRIILLFFRLVCSHCVSRVIPADRLSARLESVTLLQRWSEGARMVGNFQAFLRGKWARFLWVPTR